MKAGLVTLHRVLIVASAAKPPQPKPVSIPRVFPGTSVVLSTPSSQGGDAQMLPALLSLQLQPPRTDLGLFSEQIHPKFHHTLGFSHPPSHE